MHTFQYVVSGLCSIALVAAPVAAPLARGSVDEPWEVVPDESLAALRGGIDLGELVANFAIQRVVEIDGVVVARMQIVISNLDRLSSGGMPTISVSGPLAQIVQFMNAAGNSSGAAATASVPTSGASPAAPSVSQLASAIPVQPATGSVTPAATPLPAVQNSAPAVPAAAVPAAAVPQVASSQVASSAAAHSPAPPSTAVVGGGSAPSTTTGSGPSIAASGGNAGSVSASGTQSGSMAQAGSALANAVSTANGALAQPAASTTAASTPGLASAPIAAANTSSHVAPPTSVSALAAPANPSVQAGTTKTIPIGTTGQVVVLSNLPNAAAITTAVQNNVHAATVQTQTTISATLNSLAFLNAFTLANSIRQQVAAGP
jgi:hypothetical protein